MAESSFYEYGREKYEAFCQRFSIITPINSTRRPEKYRNIDTANRTRHCKISMDTPLEYGRANKMDIVAIVNILVTHSRVKVTLCQCVNGNVPSCRAALKFRHDFRMSDAISVIDLAVYTVSHITLLVPARQVIKRLSARVIRTVRRRN